MDLNVKRLYRKYCPGIDKLMSSQRKKELLLWSDFNDICKNDEISCMEEYLILLKIRANEYCEDNLRLRIDEILIKFRKKSWEMLNPKNEFRYENIKDIA